MLAHERQQRILEILKSQETVRTIEVAESLGVTDETIRKDFELLEKQGEARRIHGGLSRIQTLQSDLTFLERQAVQRDAKRAIARAAATRIQANEIIFLDASSTALTLTEFLPDIPLTVLTNALNVLTALSDRPQLELMSTGGLFDPRSRSFIGLTAEKSLKRYNIHRAFLSGRGFDESRGASESNSRQAALKERVVDHSEEVVFLADHTKLGSKASFFFAEPHQISCLVTDQAANQSFLESLRSQGMDVTVGS